MKLSCVANREESIRSREINPEKYSNRTCTKERAQKELDRVPNSSLISPLSTFENLKPLSCSKPFLNIQYKPEEDASSHVIPSGLGSYPSTHQQFYQEEIKLRQGYMPISKVKKTFVIKKLTNMVFKFD